MLEWRGDEGSYGFAKGGGINYQSDEYENTLGNKPFVNILNRRLTDNELEHLDYLNQLINQANEYTYAINNHNEYDLIAYRDLLLKQAYAMVDKLQEGQYK